MKNEHLVPVNVQDIVEKVMLKGVANHGYNNNEYQNYILRLEAIRDYCAEALRKAENRPHQQSYKRRT